MLLAEDGTLAKLLGIFGPYGVLPLEFTPANGVGDLLMQHMDELEQEADKKGGMQQVLHERSTKGNEKPRLHMELWPEQ